MAKKSRRWAPQMCPSGEINSLHQHRKKAFVFVSFFVSSFCQALSQRAQVPRHGSRDQRTGSRSSRPAPPAEPCALCLQAPSQVRASWRARAGISHVRFPPTSHRPGGPTRCCPGLATHRALPRPEQTAERCVPAGDHSWFLMNLSSPVYILFCKHGAGSRAQDATIPRSAPVAHGAAPRFPCPEQPAERCAPCLQASVSQVRAEEGRGKQPRAASRAQGAPLPRPAPHLRAVGISESRISCCLIHGQPSASRVCSMLQVAYSP